MIIPARDRNHLLRVECFAEHNKRFHDLRHGFALVVDSGKAEELDVSALDGIFDAIMA